jgi:L-amino acid N-acyltransferase YncA
LAPTNTRVGYLLLKRESSRIFITEVVESSFHHIGIGSRMIQFAIDNINLDESIVARILNFNEPSIRLHIANGFTLESADEFISTYVYTKK